MPRSANGNVGNFHKIARQAGFDGRAFSVGCSCISLQGKFSDNLHSTCGVQCHASFFLVLFVLWALEGNLKVAPDTYQGIKNDMVMGNNCSWYNWCYYWIS